MPGMPGGFHEQEKIDDDHRSLVAELMGDINNKLGANHANFHINKVFSQVVAGMYYHFHLTGDNDEKLSALIFRPLPHTNEGPRVERV